MTDNEINELVSNVEARLSWKSKMTPNELRTVYTQLCVDEVPKLLKAIRKLQEDYAHLEESTEPPCCNMHDY